MDVGSSIKEQEKEKEKDKVDIAAEKIINALKFNYLDELPIDYRVNFVYDCIYQQKIFAFKDALLIVLGTQNIPYSVYQKLITYSLKQRDGILAYKIFQQLCDSNFQVNVVTYCSLIAGLLKTRRKKGTPNIILAYDIWIQLKNSGLQLDDVAYRTGINACVEKGEMSEALSLFAGLQQKDVRVYNMIIKGYGRMGDVAAARKWLRLMKDAGISPTIITYNTLVYSAARIGHLPLAQAFMDKAVREGLTPDSWCYCALLKGYLEQGQTEQADQLLQQSIEQGVQVGVVGYTTILDSLIKQGHLSAALEMLQWMQNQNIKPNSVSFNTVLKGYAKQGTQEEVQALLERMHELNISINTDTFNTLISNKVHQKESAQAIQLFRRMISMGINPDTISYTCMIQAFSQRNQSQACLQLFEELQNDDSDPLFPDIFSRSALVGILSKLGELDLAKDGVQQIVWICQEKEQKQNSQVQQKYQQQVVPPIQAFGALLYGYVKQDMVDEAVDTIRWYIAVGGQADETMYTQTIEVCLRNDELRKAKQIVRAMELMNVNIGEGKFVELVQRVQQSQSSSKKITNQPSAVDRFKWWLGFPNNLYQSDWDP